MQRAARLPPQGGNKVLTPLLTFRGCPSPSRPRLLSFCRSSPLSRNSPEAVKKASLSLEENSKITNICIFFPVQPGACQCAAWRCGLLSHSRNYPSVFMFSSANASGSLRLSACVSHSSSFTLGSVTIQDSANDLWRNARDATAMHSPTLVRLSRDSHLE